MDSKKKSIIKQKKTHALRKTENNKTRRIKIYKPNKKFIIVCFFFVVCGSFGLYIDYSFRDLIN